jgi:two-component system nitrate/nitrite response regulator NarL
MNVGGQPIRILIVDSQVMFREGLRLLLGAEPDFQVIADTGDADEVPKLVAGFDPDILLIDVTRLRSNSGNSGLKLLDQLISTANKVRPILMTAAIDRNGTFKALKIGIRGVLTKQSGIALFSKCIRTVMAGEYWISHDIISELIVSFNSLSTQLAGKPKPAGCHFSEREEQVLRAIVYGYSNKDIAKELAVSEQAVKYHLTRIFRKAGVSSRMELARFTIANELVADA